ncbi:hypothetical protein KC19_12G056800 [Ceratodon purpureus]|uniref:TIR domain-containing protein n=1 Tax=Ceratodon purpureus TaxID=3225 RepID=A0A8T0G7L3_CERPU|nr:hypothetical protein KC19_12G056800 [Ceratodon purpureus]
MASTSSSGRAQCEHIDDVAGQSIQVSTLSNQPGSPFSERIFGIPQAPSTPIVLEPTSKFHSVATWLLGYLRYTCVVLGFLGTCLPSIQVEARDDEGDMISNVVNCELSGDNADNEVYDESDHILEAKHKIFLSHSGAQKDFVEQLCVDLERCDRYPFFDKRRSSLPIGEKFPKLIFDAIEQCHVGVVVLSKEFFTKSKWPMLELNAMVKESKKPSSRIKIIPIYYLISIEDFKDIKIQKQWISHWQKWSKKDIRIKVEEWKDALKVLASINGLLMKGGCCDVQFREEIVMEVCGLVSSETRWDDSHVQGRSRSCKVIEDKMDQVLTNSNSRVCIVGLYGMGGIGKTTISKALCNELALKFCDNVCHIELGRGSELELLRKALKKLSKIRHDVLDKLDDIELGYAYLKKQLCTQPIFLTLDNVHDDFKTLEVAQTYLKASYGSGSVVLVTARSISVLKKLNLDATNCLEMPELEENEAETLFLSYADLPSRHEVDEGLLKDCIERCHFLKGDGRSRHYHPLALKVLGQQLGCNTTKWAAQLRNIDTFNQLKDKTNPVYSILRNSYDSLDRKHQMMFMDLALLVTPECDNHEVGVTRRDLLCYVHEAAVEDVKDMLEVLKRKSLLEDLSEDFTKIGMHDLWIEFAVAETKAHDSREQRWVYHVDGKKALGRSGRWRESVERMCFLEEGWRGLEGLDLSDFVNVEAFRLEVLILTLDCDLDLDLSGLKHLKSLELDTPGLTVRAEGLSSLSSLVSLSWITPRFAPCLDGIGRLTKLQNLELADCKGTRVLDLTELRFLRIVVINRFPDLISLKGLSSRMAALRILRIPHCKSLRECPGVGELYALEQLVLSGCGKLEKLPRLGRLKKLRELCINDCKSIREVPGLSDLVSLEGFYAEGCSKLVILPDLAKLTKLRELDVAKCPVQKVPRLDGLLSMTELYASFGKLSGEQPVLSKLSALKIVVIDGWNGPIWASIRSLLMLEVLQLFVCKGDDVMPDLQNLERLREVALVGCEYKDLSGLSNSTALETLSLDRCEKLERLPEFGRLTKLTSLTIVGCPNLRDWRSESTLCSLKTLAVNGSSVTSFVRDLETLTRLRELYLNGSECENVLSLTSLCLQLEVLSINRFSKMEALDLTNFSYLEKLELEGCSALERVTCGNPLTELTKLKVIDCESLVEIPDLSAFPQLEKLRLEECRALTKLSCSDRLTAVRKIELIGCDLDEEVLDFSRFQNLREFRVEDASSSDDDEGDGSGDEGSASGDDDENIEQVEAIADALT